MSGKSNKKYILFPIIMIIIAIITTFDGHRYGGIFETLDKYDMTGMAKIIMYIMLFAEIAVLAFCVYKGKKGLKEGYDYLFSKFACIIFIILIIIPIISFLAVRSEEEKIAKEFENKYDEIFYTDLKNNNSKKMLNDLKEYSEIMENDIFFERKKEIISEMKEKSIAESFIHHFVLNRYNYNILTYKSNKYLKPEDRYYAIFSRPCCLNIICFAFYLISWTTDKRLNKMRKNRRRRD